MLTPAKKLEDVYKTLSSEPLLESDEMQAFYCADINRVRGEDQLMSMRRRLNRHFGGAFYKALVMGHSGVGKSTEFTRLLDDVKEQFQPIRFSAVDELHPDSFQAFDVLMLMMFEVARRTGMKKSEGGAGKKPPPQRLQEIIDYFSTEENKRTIKRHHGVEAAAGVGPKATSPWATFLGLFASVKGEIKFAADRERTIVEYRLQRMSELTEMVNRLLDDCNALMRRETQKEWLFVGEDFDKHQIAPERSRALYLTHGNILKDLRAHLIMTLPVELGYSEYAARLSISEIINIPDTPVYHADHRPHGEGRKAVQKTLHARVVSALFQPNQAMRLVVASGGNLRDLFRMTVDAADHALNRNATKIGAENVLYAINSLRNDYTRLLSESAFDSTSISYEAKVERLMAIYNGDPTTKITGAAMHSLLRARAIQEFNGERRFGVHPLVVDILKEQGHIQPAQRGGTE